MAHLPEGLDIQRLKTYSLFQDMELSEITDLVANSQVTDYTKDRAVIVREGEAGSGLALILKGQVKVFKADAKKEGHLLGVLKEGDFFGEMALIDQKGRSASVSAMSDTCILWMSSDSFFKLLRTHGELMAKLLFRMTMDLSKRLRFLNERYVVVKGHLDGA